MIYIVVQYCEEIIGVFDNLPSASELAKELNAEAGYVLGDRGYPCTIEAHVINDPEALHEEVDEPWLLKDPAETQEQN